LDTRISKLWSGLERDLWTKWVWLLVFNGALVAWLLVRPAGATAVRLVCAAANIVAPLVGLAWCMPWWGLRRGRGADAAHSSPPTGPHAWSAFAFGGGLALLAAAQCAWYYFELIRQQPPFPSWADVGYCCSYPLLVAGILLAPKRPLSLFRRGRVVLDSAITIAALASVCWYFLLGPIILGASQAPLAKVLGVAYPVGDLVVLFCLLLTSAQADDEHMRRGLMPLTLGLFVIFITDVVFGYQTLNARYVPGRILDAGWPLGYMLVGLGARAVLRPASSPAADAHVQSRFHAAPSPLSAWRSLLPSALVPVVGGLTVYASARHHHDVLEMGLWCSFGAVVVLALLRQLVTMHENGRLYAKLHDAFAEATQSHQDLAEANAAMRRSEERFRTAATCARDVIYEWHTDTGELEWFGDVDSQVGRTDAPLPRTPEAWEAVIHPDDRPRVVAALDKHVRSGEPFNVQYRVCLPDGSVRHWRDRGRIITGEGGARRRMIGVVSDVTDHQRAAALERERQGLREAVSGMEAVLGVVGHELRTPLAGVRAMSEFLLAEGAPESPEWRPMLAGVHEEIVRMAETLNDLLEAARLNRGLAHWRWERFALAAVCEDALGSVRPLVDPERVRLSVTVDPPDAQMSGDADAIRRLVLNFVSNSRKHTTDGEIAVTADFATDEGNDQGQWVRISVRDTGSGIPPQILDRLGEAFALNAGLVGDKHVGGAGLGLAICKGIATAHGGGLEVMSAVGKGTTITARLRADLPSPATEYGKVFTPTHGTSPLIRNRLSANAEAEAA
jgi:PAS domain S-box-containing protein